MKKIDHKALAQRLLSVSENADLLKHKKAFLIGCVEPDYNYLTYFRGFIHNKAFHGHNAENSQKHIQKCVKKLQKKGSNSLFKCFTLGTLIHYIADTFTYPHNASFEGSLKKHVAYEAELHHVFEERLAVGLEQPGKEQSTSLWSFLQKEHDGYCSSAHSIDIDCSYILRVCATVLDELLGVNRALA